MQYDLPMTCVVFNDNALGMVLDHQPRGAGDSVGVLPDGQRRHSAGGFGCYGVHVEDSRDLPDALREARDSGLPAVVDVAIDREPSPGRLAGGRETGRGRLRPREELRIMTD